MRIPTDEDDARTVAEMRGILDAEHESEQDGFCPTCRRTTPIKKYTICKQDVVYLEQTFKLAGIGWLHWPSTFTRRAGGDGAKLAHWGLVATPPRFDNEERQLCAEIGVDTSTIPPYSGNWRVTDRGIEYLRGHLAVPEFAVTYNGELVRLKGELRRVSAVKHVNFDELCHFTPRDEEASQ